MSNYLHSFSIHEEILNRIVEIHFEAASQINTCTYKNTVNKREKGKKNNRDKISLVFRY